MQTEFDEVRHGYAPPREHNRLRPEGSMNTPTDVNMHWPGAQWEEDTADHDTSRWTEPGIIETACKLLLQFQALAVAELELIKVRVTVCLDAAKVLAIYATVAVIIAFALFVAVIFGSMLILAEWFGPLIATAIVCGVSLLLIGILGLLALRQAKRLMAAVKD